MCFVKLGLRSVLCRTVTSPCVVLFRIGCDMFGTLATQCSALHIVFPDAPRTMPLTGTDKRRAKEQVMAKVTPWLISQGFERISGGRTGGRFDFVSDDGARLVLSIAVPTFDTFFRFWCHWETAIGNRVADGPQSLPYECPNHPGRRRYSFRFHRDNESQQRCVVNMQDWIRDELLPWFASRPTENWSNPYVFRP